jgi:hypothetical protein
MTDNKKGETGQSDPESGQTIAHHSLAQHHAPIPRRLSALSFIAAH